MGMEVARSVSGIESATTSAETRRHAQIELCQISDLGNLSAAWVESQDRSAPCINGGWWGDILLYLFDLNAVTRHLHQKNTNVPVVEPMSGCLTVCSHWESIVFTG